MNVEQDRLMRNEGVDEYIQLKMRIAALEAELTAERAARTRAEAERDEDADVEELSLEELAEEMSRSAGASECSCGQVIIGAPKTASEILLEEVEMATTAPGLLEELRELTKKMQRSIDAGADDAYGRGFDEGTKSWRVQLNALLAKYAPNETAGGVQEAHNDDR